MENYARPTGQKERGKEGFSQVPVVAVIETMPWGH